MYDVTMTSFLCFHQRTGLKAKNVIMTSYWRQIVNLCYFWTQWPKRSLYTEFQLNIFTNGRFFTFLWSQILQGTICNFVVMATAQNVTNWFYLQKVS